MSSQDSLQSLLTVELDLELDLASQEEVFLASLLEKGLDIKLLVYLLVIMFQLKLQPKLEGV